MTSVPPVSLPRFSQPQVTRFAPSPTGYLHLGHAYAAVIAHDIARASGGTFLLRIEDIDATRCRPKFEQAIYDDLAWLGLNWDGDVRRQSAYMDLYEAKLKELEGRGLVYPCFCTRKEIRQEIEQMSAAPHFQGAGPEGPVYPGTCRGLGAAQIAEKEKDGRTAAGRLDLVQALEQTGALAFQEFRRQPTNIRADPRAFGDVILARRDVGVSYHLAVTLDDHDQGVTVVTRGEDLFAATSLQRLLQALLGLSVPRYFHHPLIRTADGRRLAKRDRDQTLRALRAAGVTPADIRRDLGLPVL